MSNRVSLGEAIKNFRNERGISRSKMARELGVLRNALWRYENDERIPKVSFSLHFYDVYGVTLEDLILKGEKQ